MQVKLIGHPYSKYLFEYIILVVCKVCYQTVCYTSSVVYLAYAFNILSCKQAV